MLYGFHNIVARTGIAMQSQSNTHVEHDLVGTSTLLDGDLSEIITVGETRADGKTYVEGRSQTKFVSGPDGADCALIFRGFVVISDLVIYP